MEASNGTFLYIISAILLPIFFLLSFFFSLSETSIIALSKIRVRHLLAKGVKRGTKLKVVSTIKHVILNHCDIGCGGYPRAN
mgnify:CR=1 FL=1